jgi:hypothetical protein
MQQERKIPMSLSNEDKLRFILFQTQAHALPKAYRIDRVDAQSLDYTRIATRDGVGADQGFKGHIELIKVFDETNGYLDAFRFSSVGSPRRGDYVIKVHSWELRSTTMFGEEFDRLPMDNGDIRWDDVAL